jgi:hypothetical protein
MSVMMNLSPAWFAVADDENLLEGVVDIDFVEHLVDVDGADRADLSDAGIGG